MGMGRVGIAAGVSVLAIVIYSSPSWKLRGALGPSDLPPIVAPDLTMYLNLASLTPDGKGNVINPYYRIPVPANGAGYLKFGLAARSFGIINRHVHGHRWLTLFIWNAFWWACISIAAIWLFARFLPSTSQWLIALGVSLLLFFNFGIARTIVSAWVHLPSLAAFKGLELPFIRAFIPVIPFVFVLAYLGCQMETLRKERWPVWLAMAALQLLGLAVFPYATLIMAGITAVAVVSQVIRLGTAKIWRTALLYAISCALLDGAFLSHGSVGFYESGSPAIHFQLHLLPHLIGGNWLLVVLLTIAVALTRNLVPEIKWPLVGLGGGNALLMLGDAVVPATQILLSHHAGYFVHLTVATLLTFFIAGGIARLHAEKSWVLRGLIALGVLAVIANGVLMALGTYRAFLSSNRDAWEIANLERVWTPATGDLVIARSKDVDDACGWMSLMYPAPVLFCTDAEVMLTPQQAREVHRFRQALYLYFAHEDSASLQVKLSAADPSKLMYRLGYWSEAVSLSQEERRQGIKEIQTDLIPRMREVEGHDSSTGAFLRQFSRIVVIDKQQDPTFAYDRLASLMDIQGQQNLGNFEVLFFKPH